MSGVALARHLTDDPEAYEWYLRARHAVLRGTEEDILQARELLARATARDPQFALAHTSPRRHICHGGHRRL